MFHFIEANKCFKEQLIVCLHNPKAVKRKNDDDGIL